MIIQIKNRKEAECVALERYYHLLGNTVEVDQLDYYVMEDDQFVCVPAKCRVKILTTEEQDVVRYSDGDYIDPLYMVEIVEVINTSKIEEHRRHLVKVGYQAEIYGETIEVLGD
jgi:hypothetical protein